jgi:hypothetical protein
MDALGAAQAGSSFGEQHFGHCKLGDKRLTDRLVGTADAIMRHPGGTLPDKLNRDADLTGFYRLANNPKVTHAKLIAAHAKRTRELIASAAAGAVVLIIHDTTEADYSGLDVEGLGQIGNGGGRGFLLHNSLAYDFTAGEALGLLGQLARTRRAVPKGESPKVKRDHPQRESRFWKDGWEAVGPVEGKRVVHVADRGADLTEFLAAVDGAGDQYVVRSKSNRNVELDDGAGGVTRAKLHAFARALPDLGERSVDVSTNKGHKGRVAQVRIAAGAVSIRAPHFARGEHASENLAAWVIHVREVGTPPDGEAALEWILLTNVPAPDLASAAERVDWYACRPVIEEFHKAMKTGCGLELAQFTTAHALMVTIAIVSVVATQLLRLRDLARNPDAADRPAAEVIDPLYIDAIVGWRFKVPRPASLTVREFCMALAKLGGHLNRKGDGPPGWLVLWRGWTKLQPIVDGMQIERRRRCV